MERVQILFTVYVEVDVNLPLKRDVWDRFPVRKLLDSLEVLVTKLYK